MGNLLAVILFVLPLGALVPDAAGEEPRHRSETPVPVGEPGTEPIPPEASLLRPTLWKSDPKLQIQGASSAKGDGPSQSTTAAPEGKPGEVSPCEQKNPLSLLETLAEIERPQAAPQGGVYFMGRLRDVTQVFYLKSPQDLPEPRTAYPRGVASYRVSPDGAELLVLRSTDGQRNWQLDRVSAKSPQGEPVAGQGQERVDSMEWLSGSQWVYTLTEDGKKWKLVTQSAGQNPKVVGGFEQPLRIVDVSPDRKLLLLARLISSGQEEIQVWSLEKNQPVPPSIVASVAHARFSADGNGVFILSDRGNGPIRLYHYDRQSGSDLRLISPRTASVDDFRLSQARDHLYFTTVEKGYHSVAGLLIDPRGRTRKGLSVPEKGAWVTEGMSPTPQALFAVRSNARHSSNLWQWKKEKWTPWTRAQTPLLHPNCIALPEYVEYPGENALPIPAFLYRPAGKLPGAFVIRLPSVAGEGFLPSFHRDILYFVERGYGVLAPNLRGAPYGSRKFRDMDNGPLRVQAVGDVVAGAAWLVQRRLAETGRISLFGDHYGGTLALLSLQKKQSLFAGAFVGEPVLEPIEFIQRAPAAERPALTYEFGLLEGAPWASSLSPTKGMEGLKRPILAFESGTVQRTFPKPSPLKEYLPSPKPPYQGAAVPSARLKWAQRAAFLFEKWAQKEKGP